jgi:hypothetical protein
VFEIFVRFVSDNNRKECRYDSKLTTEEYIHIYGILKKVIDEMFLLIFTKKNILKVLRFQKSIIDVLKVYHKENQLMYSKRNKFNKMTIKTFEFEINKSLEYDQMNKMPVMSVSLLNNNCECKLIRVDTLTKRAYIDASEIYKKASEEVKSIALFLIKLVNALDEIMINIKKGEKTIIPRLQTLCTFFGASYLETLCSVCPESDDEKEWKQYKANIENVLFSLIELLSSNN